MSEFERIMQEMADDVDRLGYCLAKTELAYRMWCLGHNFDVVATIMSMSHFSWEQGFAAGRTIASICEPS